MDICVLIHLEASTDNEAIWWAESDDIPGMTVSAGSLAELRDAIRESLLEFNDLMAGDEPIAVTAERLVSTAMPPMAGDGSVVDPEDSSDAVDVSPAFAMV